MSDDPRASRSFRAAPSRRWPAEWESHEATWIAWPHNEGTWPGVHSRVLDVWPRIIEAIAEGEEVRILAPDDASRDRLAATIGAELPRRSVRWLSVPTDDAWIRDFGPIVVRTRDERIAVDWQFDSWGGKYPFERDAAAGAALALDAGLPLEQPPWILEGGSIDGNGEGTVITTESCLLRANRNSGASQRDLEDALARHLGARRVLWLGAGIAGDDTDGHVDDLTRFVSRTRVLTAVEERPSDENYRMLRENRERLDDLRCAGGERLEVIELPMPEPVFHGDLRCPASYANFYIANACVLVPVFATENDARALGILGELFPDRRVVGVPARDIVLGLGAIHCLTQQVPSSAVPFRLEESE